MNNIKEVNGDLIDLSLNNNFDVVCQGNNCFCLQKRGISIEFVSYFNTDNFELENIKYKGDKSKLGRIDYEYNNKYNLYVVNCYTQYYYGTKFGIPVDYNALRSCMKEINKTFTGKRIGLPRIGAGLARGNWSIIKEIIQEELIDCDVTIVNYGKRV